MHIEIRPGEGGDDAAAFATELARIIRATHTRTGGTVEIDTTNPRLVTVTLDTAPAWVHDLAGVHRIQRIPRNDGTRRHTSTVTVAVLDHPAAAPTVDIDHRDLRIEPFQASGPGGQHRNRTLSAVRVTHTPSGTVVTCADERHQHQNRRKAIAELRRRLTDQAVDAAASERNAARTDQISTGERPARTWQWNHQRGIATHEPSGRRWRIEDLRRGRGLTRTA